MNVQVIKLINDKLKLIIRDRRRCLPANLGIHLIAVKGSIIFEQRIGKRYLIVYKNKEDSDQSAQTRSLIRAFPVCICGSWVKQRCEKSSNIQ